MTLQIYVRYLVSSPCVVTPGGLETKRPVSELYGHSGSPAAPRVTITSSPASAGLFLVRFRTILVWNGFLPLAFVIYRTNGAMGCDDQGRRVSRQGTRVRRTRRTDARFLYQGTIPRSCEEVAPDGRTRRAVRRASKTRGQEPRMQPAFPPLRDVIKRGFFLIHEGGLGGRGTRPCVAPHGFLRSDRVGALLGDGPHL